MKIDTKTSMKQRSIVVTLAWVVLGFVVLIAAFGSWIMPHDPNVGNIRNTLASPNGDFWLGTDYLGRDVLSRLIAGSRVALLAGLEATAVALFIGVSVGMVVGLAGGWTDRIAMRIIDGLSAIPALVLAIAIIATLGSGVTRSMFAAGVAYSMGLARLARGLTLAERDAVYVDGARVVGARTWRLLRHHIAPNIVGPIAVQATLVFASAIIIEASLSYLGLGVQPPEASWGSMLANAQRTVRQAPFQAIPPGLALAATVLSINVLGDALVRTHKGESFAHPTGYLEPVSVAKSTNSETPTRTNESGNANLLNVDGLFVRYGTFTAVNGASIQIAPGEVVALVGESGSGKTSLAMAIAGLLAPPAQVGANTVSLTNSGDSLELIGASTKETRNWRHNIGVVFQEPSASLNPLQSVAHQVRDVIRANPQTSAAAMEAKGHDEDAYIEELLTDVGLRRPTEVMKLRPNQLSGGMAQRVVIAMALAKNPALLVADEPTTALDVTVEAEIIRLLRRLCEERHFGVLLVTHDLGVAGELADRVLVMYQGNIVETGAVQELALYPKHPYTSALIAAVPQNEPGRKILVPPEDRLSKRAGIAPELLSSEVGCSYRHRCPYAVDECYRTEPLLGVAITPANDSNHLAACHRANELNLDGADGMVDAREKVVAQPSDGAGPKDEANL